MNENKDDENPFINEYLKIKRTRHNYFIGFLLLNI